MKSSHGFNTSFSAQISVKTLPNMVLPVLTAQGPWYIVSLSRHQGDLLLAQKWEEKDFFLRHGEFETTMEVKILSSLSLENSPS